MRLLLDTHVVVWWIEGDHTLSPAAVEAIADEHADVAFSVLAPWELAIKASIGKLTLRHDLRAELREQDVAEVPIRGEHTVAVGRLPLHHRDPFDRMLIAQAITDGRTLVTSDRALAAYDVPILWA